MNSPAKIAVGIAFLATLAVVMGQVLFNGVKTGVVSPWTGVSYSKAEHRMMYRRYMTGFAIMFVAALIELAVYITNVAMAGL